MLKEEVTNEKGDGIRENRHIRRGREKGLESREKDRWEKGKEGKGEGKRGKREEKIGKGKGRREH